MNMPITVEIADLTVKPDDIDGIFAYFSEIDRKFSVYRTDSEISRINRGEIRPEGQSPDMKYILSAAGETEVLTRGYFNIHRPDGITDPSGIVKGWAIYQAAKKIEKKGFKNYYVDAGGDIQVKGRNHQNLPWKIGIRNPFNRDENIKIIAIGDQGVATSGTYIRGQHIYNPVTPERGTRDIVSITVIGPDVYQADYLATAAFAMQNEGPGFISSLEGFEAYSVNSKGIATFTPGFEKYVVKSN